MDPMIYSLVSKRSLSPGRVLREFRARFRDLHWASESPDTLLSPVYSTADSIARFEDRLVALFTAHLKVLDAVSSKPCGGGGWSDYVRLYRVIRAFHLDWPVIGNRESVTPALLSSAESRRLLYGRPDIVIGPEGPLVVETNFDTAIAGFDRPDDMWQLAAELFEPEGSYLATGRPIQGLASYFEELAGGKPTMIHWLMKNDAPMRYEYDRLLAALNALADKVCHLVHYAGDDVGSTGHDLPGYLHRACSLLTVNQDRDRFTTTLEQLALRTHACTVPVSLSQIESKLFLAWLSDPCARPCSLTAAEIEAVTTLIPWTRLLKRLHGEELDRVRRNRGDFILKKTDSYQALDVFFGCNMPEDEWCALLDTKLAEPVLSFGVPNFWIAQERVRPKEYHLLEYTDAGLLERQIGLSCCPYILGGRIRGLETWVMPFVPHLDMIRRMQFVAHFIRR